MKRVSVWNMKVGRGKAAIDGLHELIEDQDPDAILLQEAMNYVKAIRREFGGEWRIYSGTPYTERANCPVMVRRHVPHGGERGVDWGIVSCRRTWTYRGKGRFVTHKGRKWTWALAADVPLRSMHRATEALGFNDAAGDEEARKIRRWTRRNGTSLIGGDWNNVHDDRRDNSPSDTATRVKGQLVVPEGARIDYALVKGLDDVKARRGKRYGSDHHSHYYDL